VEVTWLAGFIVRGKEPLERPLMPNDQWYSVSAMSVPDVEDTTTLRAELWFRDATGTSWRARPDGIFEEVPHGKEPPKVV